MSHVVLEVPPATSWAYRIALHAQYMSWATNSHPEGFMGSHPVAQEIRAGAPLLVLDINDDQEN